jgi:hypothetical protein
VKVITDFPDLASSHIHGQIRIQRRLQVLLRMLPIQIESNYLPRSVHASIRSPSSQNSAAIPAQLLESGFNNRLDGACLVLIGLPLKTKKIGTVV